MRLKDGNNVRARRAAADEPEAVAVSKSSKATHKGTAAPLSHAKRALGCRLGR